MMKSESLSFAFIFLANEDGSCLPAKTCANPVSWILNDEIVPSLIYDFLRE